MQSTSFCLGKFLKWWADDQSCSITKGSIYYIIYMYVQPFSMEVDSWEISHQIDVSTMLCICTYCVFTLWGTFPSLHNNKVYCNKVNWRCNALCWAVVDKGQCIICSCIAVEEHVQKLSWLLWSCLCVSYVNSNKTWYLHIQCGSK